MTAAAMPADVPSDEELMRRFRGSLEEAPLHEIVRRYRGPGVALAEGRLGNRAAAEDAVQESFIRVVRERERYDASRPFAPWFFAILRNVCTDQQRKDARYRERLAELEAEGPRPAPSARAGDVLEAMAALSHGEREVLALRLLDGLPFREIAERLGCSEDAAKKRAQRALRALRERVEEKPR